MSVRQMPVLYQANDLYWNRHDSRKLHLRFLDHNTLDYLLKQRLAVTGTQIGEGLLCMLTLYFGFDIFIKS